MTWHGLVLKRRSVERCYMLNTECLEVLFVFGFRGEVKSGFFLQSKFPQSVSQSPRR